MRLCLGVSLMGVCVQRGVCVYRISPGRGVVDTPWTQRQTPPRPRGRHSPDPGADTPDPEADTPPPVNRMTDRQV